MDDLQPTKADAVTLKRYGAKQREWTEKRDIAVAQAHRDGMSLRGIADAVGLSHTAVANIVNRQTDR